MKSSNPFLSNPTNNQTGFDTFTQTEKFSTRGALSKALISLLALTVGVVIITSSTTLLSIAASLYLPLAIISIIGFLIIGRSVVKTPAKAKNLIGFYIIIESILLSVMIASANVYVPGAGITAGIVTIGFVILMASLYNIAPNLIGKIQPLVIGAMGILFILMLVNLVFSMFGAGFLPYDSLGFIGLLIVISAFSIAVDFRQIDMMEQAGLSKEYEYIAAFGLITSIVWLYINILRFILVSRD